MKTPEALRAAGHAAAGLARGTSFGSDRLRVDVLRTTSLAAELARDVRQGLLAPRKSLPPKYFYDDRGARLFDAICDLPEYYLTRTEQALLADIADEIVAVAQADDIVEFGSGAARKTRLIFDALQRAERPARYIPIDISERMMRHAATALLHDYPLLSIHAVVGDYERDLARIPSDQRRLVLFLGSTIGNFTRAATARFLNTVRRHLWVGDHLLLGVDLVKPVAVLEAAYNDAAGVTAEFNRNVLRVINQHLDADFAPERFAHLGVFNHDESQIEMYLRATTTQLVAIRALGLTIPFTAGETIHTEISRKFTQAEVESTLSVAGFRMRHWYTSPDNYFGLALAHAA